MNKLLLLISLFVVAIVCEAVWPLRRQTQPKLNRIVQNFSLAAISALFVRYAFLPIELWAAEYSLNSGIGLLRLAALPIWINSCLGLIFLEYSLYWWHRLNHRSKFFWRFHNIHHFDRDMDVSTASRFHFGELAFSSVYRVSQIFLFGINIQTLLLFETLITAFAQFHHSNIRIPKRLEFVIMKIFVTPRMHGIHHSIVLDETDSNYGTVFAFWDRLHSTKKIDVPQDEITIGVPGYMNESDHRISNVLTEPFKKQREWQSKDGTIPQRAKVRGGGVD